MILWGTATNWTPREPDLSIAPRRRAYIDAPKTGEERRETMNRRRFKQRQYVVGEWRGHE